MSRIDEYKRDLEPREKTFLEEYEQAIHDLLNDINRTNNLKKKNDLTQERVKRFDKLRASTNVANLLFNNANKIFAKDDANKIRANIKKLNELELGLNVDEKQYISILCHIYQVNSERLRLQLLTFIDFDSNPLKVKEPKTLGQLINELEKNYSYNKFVKYLTGKSKTRNAVAHYSYFYEEGEINLCENYFTPSPKPMGLADFMRESKELNILTEAFYCIFSDKYILEDE